ncbi:MAG: hypothetical protein ACYS1A_20320 [Planctomycetota bacterium]
MQEVTIKRGGCTYRCYLKNLGPGRGRGYRVYCPKVDVKCKPGVAPTSITPTKKIVDELSPTERGELRDNIHQMITRTGTQGVIQQEVPGMFPDYSEAEVQGQITYLLQTKKIAFIPGKMKILVDPVIVEAKPDAGNTELLLSEMLKAISETGKTGRHRDRLVDIFHRFEEKEVNDAIAKLIKDGQIKFKPMEPNTFIATDLKTVKPKLHKQLIRDVFTVVTATKGGIAKTILDQSLPNYTSAQISEALKWLRTNGQVEKPAAGIWIAIGPKVKGVTLQTTDPKKAAHLRKSADGMTKTIEAKLNPPIGEQRTTARRARIAQSMREEGQQLKEIQFKLY